MKHEPYETTPYRLTPREKAAELKMLRALIARDFSASRMSNTKWKHVLMDLKGIPIHMRFKCVDIETVRVGWLWPWVEDYVDGPVGPFLTLWLEWVEINPIQRVHRGALIAPEIVDHTAEVEAVLQSLNVPYEWNENWMRIIGHVQNTSSAREGGDLHC